MTATEVGAPTARPLHPPGREPTRTEPPALEQWQQMLDPALPAQPRRRLFHERLERALAGGVAAPGVLAVLSLGLEGLRSIPDRHGRDTADEAMRIVAARMMLATRVQDAVCRVGDDEFACLLVDADDREQLRLRAGTLADAVAAPLLLGGVRLHLQPSIGIAIYPSDGATGARLLKRADAARLRARRWQQALAFFDRQADL